MRKKVEEKKEMVPVCEPGLFWEYRQYPQELLEKVDVFLVTFANELKALVGMDKPLEHSFEAICEKIGVKAHPSLSQKKMQESKYPQLKNNDYGQRYVIFLNHKVDAITLKLLGFLIQTYKMNSLKLSNNSIDKEVNELKKLLEKEDALTTLFFQWNPLLDLPNRAEIFLLTARPTLQHLILRECKIGDAICKELLKKLKEFPENKLKSLDLYGNSLSNELTNEISVLIEQSKSLEFLGLSKNDLNSSFFLEKLFSCVGQIPLTEQQYESHKQKEKARDQVVERNKKRKKGIPEQPVPYLALINQTPNGRFLVKNLTLRALNLSGNNINEDAVPLIRKFLNNQGAKVDLFLEGNKFSAASKKIFAIYKNVIV